MGHGFWQPFSELTSRLLMLPVSGWLISCVFRRSTLFCLSQLGMIVHPVFLPPLPCPMSSHSVFMVSCVQHLLVAWVDLLLFCCSSALTFVDAFWFACWCLLCWHDVVWGVQLFWAVGFWWVFPPALDSSPRVFCSAFSCCKYCKVGVTFAFLCLPEDALGRLYSRFSLNKSLLMTRTACLVLKAPFSSELSELWRGELWSIVWDYNIRNAVSWKLAIQLAYTCWCFGISEPVNFPEIGEIVHSDEINCCPVS